MSTTAPVEWTGTPTLDESKVKAITAWYRLALADEDKSVDESSEAWFGGQRYALEAVLNLLYDTDTEEDQS